MYLNTICWQELLSDFDGDDYLGRSDLEETITKLVSPQRFSSADMEVSCRFGGLSWGLYLLIRCNCSVYWKIIHKLLMISNFSGCNIGGFFYMCAFMCVYLFLEYRTYKFFFGFFVCLTLYIFLVALLLFRFSSFISNLYITCQRPKTIVS